MDRFIKNEGGSGGLGFWCFWNRVCFILCLCLSVYCLSVSPSISFSLSLSLSHSLSLAHTHTQYISPSQQPAVLLLSFRSEIYSRIEINLSEDIEAIFNFGIGHPSPLPPPHTSLPSSSPLLVNGTSNLHYREMLKSSFRTNHLIF